MAEGIAKYKNDRALFHDRVRAACEACVKLPEVDPGRVAAIGYCFGGTGGIELLRDGLGLRGVVSFHGGLAPSQGRNFYGAAFVFTLRPSRAL